MLSIRTGRLGLLAASLFLFSVPASAQFQRNVNEGPTLYRDPNFTGPSRTISGDMQDLRPIGLNDQVSSIEIPPGETWEVCQDVDYGNGCQTLTNSVADLRTIGWDDRISSLRRVDGRFGGYRDRGSRDGVYRDDPFNNGPYQNDQAYGSTQAQDEVVFYDRPGYRGAATILTRDAYDQGSRVTRRAESILVRGGTWQVCDRSGRCVSVSQGVPNVDQLGLNGQITSVRPLTNSSSDSGGYYGNYRR